MGRARKEAEKAAFKKVDINQIPEHHEKDVIAEPYDPETDAGEAKELPLATAYDEEEMRRKTRSI